MTHATDKLTELPLPQLLAELGSSAAGLTTAEAQQRLERYGPNEIAERQRNPVLEFLGYFWAPIPWMIEVALALSVAARHWTDAAIIGVLLAMNGLVAFFEEHQAANAIAALKQRLATEARVLRDGAWLTVAVRELVPGDVVRVRLGDVVPADLRVLDDVTLEVDQSALTGESLAVSRGRGDSVYSGSVLVRGEADALVCATGASSYMGKTTALVESAGTVSHFQRAVLRIANYLIVIALALVTLTVVISLVRGNPVLQTLEFALVVTIASIPVALPAVLSVTMAIGARQLARHEAVVSHLPAVEELGGIDLLCSDKTGTLTQNRLALTARWTATAVSEDELLVAAALASRAEDNDPIDLAVLTAVGERRPWASVDRFVPFDPVSKRTEALVRDSGGRVFRVSKGAPQVIAALCDGDGAAAEVNDVVERFATRGYRSLGVARTDGDGSWRLMGVLALADPPRDDSAATIAAARELGIDVKMVTGDQVAIGREIARQVGLGEQILDAGMLDDAADGDDLGARVERTDGFAQVFPEHKYRIVRLLQARGHIVGMTGDGVNDAPALKQADAGIAVSGATDAARAAADVVLLAPGLSVIVSAIGLAREIFARLTSYATYRIAETIRVLLLITLAVVFMNFFPVTAAMIVFLALLNDGAILSIAYDHVRGSAKPVKWDMRAVLTIATVLGVVGVVATFTLFFIADKVFGLNHDLIRTMIYLKLSVAGQLTIFLTRSRGPFWSGPAPARLLLGAVITAQTVATLIAVYGAAMTPLGWRWAGVVWAYAVVWFLFNDRVKLAAYWWLDRHPRRDKSEIAGARV
ncbi:metal cation transporter p-type ATPase a, CtpF [Mycobacterium bohemicum DSM 44277]|uniref:Metal-transporting ATPase n=2 Tax=Mycobacterium bohemicum TaxID=56425 RepID=A0A1X1R4B7_MYCBE|nr:plasma-membrane proton-efflux P-type ATPase [Mycobacterium bohemicum]MCV6968752.1 plasma-membrane proton-efflux P-type ATPase [Mycobacterium bohemicum]ORU99173.1 metal-transporting ATPase [Mycobacterium bohemicum]CPR05526.1 metal cation transporter p-type ATPase a, CtpF [Mycobacterium bohemicum DSM 44277]